LIINWKSNFNIIIVSVERIRPGINREIDYEEVPNIVTFEIYADQTASIQNGPLDLLSVNEGECILFLSWNRVDAGDVFVVAQLVKITVSCNQILGVIRPCESKNK